MFYSQTFLARKGPLGTVWCAAHLQHRLKKSHYTSTDIPSTVDRIMFPEVPIALRMSGHLLFGVVRIYSKKVDYLFQDCNIVLSGLRKAFASIDLNLPEDARQAPFQSITFPDTFELDALDLDDIYCDSPQDNHLRNLEEITLTDQIPIGRDPYVAISFGEDILIDSSHPEEVPDSEARPMDEDVIPPTPLGSNMGFQDPASYIQIEVPKVRLDDNHSPQNIFQDPSPSNPTEVLNAGRNDDKSPQDVPDIEVMRDATHDFSSANLPLVLPDHGNVITEPNSSSDHAMKEKDILSPIMEDILAPGGKSLYIQQRSEPPPSAASREAAEIFDMHIPFGHVSPELAVRSSPPFQQQPQRRPRKRKQFFDESTVLTNKFMKKALEDPRDILRKRKDIPSSNQGLWKLKNSLRKEQVFYEPSISGLYADLCDIFKKDYILAKPHLALEEAAPEHRVESPTPVTGGFSEPGVVQSPSTPECGIARSPTSEHGDMKSPASEPRAMKSPISVPEVEHLRHEEGDALSNIPPEFMPSTASFMPSSRIDNLTPISASGSGWVPHVETTGTSTLPTPDFSASTGFQRSELQTPMTFSEERLGVENTGLPNIPEINSAEDEDLYFLEADNNTPTGSQGAQEVDTLSVRTRAVAQYLIRRSPKTPISEDLSGDISLNKILEGKTRKLCARMFFETLVLKSYGLVDVQQEPDGDITLKLTPMLSKSQI